MTQLLTFGASFPVSWSVSQLALKFHWVKMYRQCQHTNYIEITQSIMPKPVYLLTVQEEYNSLMDQIWAKYDQLDSDKYGAVGTPAFNAEACELADLLAHVSDLCQKPNLPPPMELYRPTFFKHWRCLSDQNYNRQAIWLGYGRCSFVCRYLRITGLLSTHLILRIGDWLCILPAITLVVDKSKKVNKAASLDWWTAKPTRQKAQYSSLPPWRGKMPLYTE